MFVILVSVCKSDYFMPGQQAPHSRPAPLVSKLFGTDTRSQTPCRLIKLLDLQTETKTTNSNNSHYNNYHTTNNINKSTSEKYDNNIQKKNKQY